MPTPATRGPCTTGRGEARAVPMPGKGVPLGILPGQEYECHTSALEPGDVVLLYTDGAAEVTDEEGRMLGSEGLAAFLEEETGDGTGQGEALLERLYKRVKEHCAAVSLPDDLTLLSLSRAK